MSIIVHDGSILYRSALMTEGHAESFAAALKGNSRFDGAEVVESTRTTKTGRYFVAYQPASEDAQQRLRDLEQGKRAERAASEQFTFTWNAALGCYDCQSPSGKQYETTVSSCSCPDALYRLAGTGLVCKHSANLLNQIEDGLAGEEEALSMLTRDEPVCQRCGEDAEARFPLEEEEDEQPAAPLCEECILDIEAERVVTKEEKRRIEQERFLRIFG